MYIAIIEVVPSKIQLSSLNFCKLVKNNDNITIFSVITFHLLRLYFFAFFFSPGALKGIGPPGCPGK